MKRLTLSLLLLTTLAISSNAQIVTKDSYKGKYFGFYSDSLRRAAVYNINIKRKELSLDTIILDTTNLLKYAKERIKNVNDSAMGNAHWFKMTADDTIHYEHIRYNSPEWNSPRGRYLTEMCLNGYGLNIDTNLIMIKRSFGASKELLTKLYNQIKEKYDSRYPKFRSVSYTMDSNYIHKENGNYEELKKIYMEENKNTTDIREFMHKGKIMKVLNTNSMLYDKNLKRIAIKAMDDGQMLRYLIVLLY